MAPAAPPMMGAEYLTAAVLEALWRELDAAFGMELAESKCGVQDFLKRRNPAWNLVGRVHFNIAENRKDADAPFAFLATYTTRLSAQAKAQHLPLGQALREYAGAANKERLLSLLVPVQRASETCPWLKAMVDAGEIFHPLRWTPREALQLLRDVPHLETAGVVVRMPAAWRGNRPPRPRVTGKVGSKAPSGLGQDALLDFQMEVTLDGEPLTAAEIRDLLAKTDGLALVRGRWIELDREHLQEMIERFRAVERAARENGLAFGEAMRLLAGADVAAGDAAAAEQADWAQVVAGPWLAETLRGLRSPQGLAQVDPGEALHGVLRPYQQVGVRWLYLLAKLGLGACLADDMGLGKTIQVLSLLLVLKRQESAKPQPSLLVAPASLLANWAAEIERFAPGSEGACRPSVGHAGGRTEGLRCRAAAGHRPGDHQLRLAAARAVDGGGHAGGWRCWTKRRPSRIPTPSRPARSSTCKAGAQAGAYRHAGGESAGRSVVDFRLRESGAAGNGEGVLALRQAPGRTASRLLRAAARAGAALYSAAPEDRQDGDRRPAR